MKRRIIVTGDGSTTIQLEDWNEQYHSKHGAIQEAYHVFIKNGLDELNLTSISILEMGFGTGLNALITFDEARKRNLSVDYCGFEAFPVSQKELQQLNYVSELGDDGLQEIFKNIHEVAWDKPSTITPFFSLTKRQCDFLELKGDALFNMIYFDAFGPRVQPELWSTVLFEKVFRALKPNGILVTYSAKGSVRRNLQEVGFSIERLPGPPGKREMLRATKV